MLLYRSCRTYDFLSTDGPGYGVGGPFLETFFLQWLGAGRASDPHCVSVPSAFLSFCDFFFHCFFVFCGVSPQWNGQLGCLRQDNRLLIECFCVGDVESHACEWCKAVSENGCMGVWYYHIVALVRCTW